jgi:hypothetical protein
VNWISAHRPPPMISSVTSSFSVVLTEGVLLPGWVRGACRR